MAWDVSQTQQLATTALCDVPMVELPPPPSTVLELTATAWPERVTADRYQPSDANLVTALFSFR